jgi:hypothetical protein
VVQNNEKAYPNAKECSGAGLLHRVLAPWPFDGVDHDTRHPSVSTTSPWESGREPGTPHHSLLALVPLSTSPSPASPHRQIPPPTTSMASAPAASAPPCRHMVPGSSIRRHADQKFNLISLTSLQASIPNLSRTSPLDPCFYGCGLDLAIPMPPVDGYCWDHGA